MNLKIIVAILVGLLVVQIVGAVIFFMLVQNKPQPLSSLENQQQPATNRSSSHSTGGKLVLSADKETIGVGETVVVTITLDSGNRPLDGVDASLKYDPALLEVVRTNNLAFTPGRLFPDVVLNSFNQTQGVATMSAISSLNQNFAGSGTLGTISFRAKKAGTATVKLEFTPGNTVDSNVVSDGKEILTETKDAIITIE